MKSILLIVVATLTVPMMAMADECPAGTKPYGDICVAPFERTFIPVCQVGKIKISGNDLHFVVATPTEFGASEQMFILKTSNIGEVSKFNLEWSMKIGVNCPIIYGAPNFQYDKWVHEVKYGPQRAHIETTLAVPEGTGRAFFDSKNVTAQCPGTDQEFEGGCIPRPQYNRYPNPYAEIPQNPNYPYQIPVTF